MKKMKILGIFLFLVGLSSPAFSQVPADTVKIVEIDSVKYWAVEITAQASTVSMARRIAETQGLAKIARFLADSNTVEYTVRGRQWEVLEQKVTKTRGIEVRMVVRAPVELNPKKK